MTGIVEFLPIDTANGHPRLVRTEYNSSETSIDLVDVNLEVLGPCPSPKREFSFPRQNLIHDKI